MKAIREKHNCRNVSEASLATAFTIYQDLTTLFKHNAKY